ncbi:hypothetical protein NLI96_g9287 [Meripilus lineatus]|uniref:BTB domain-containing protein n=1 Tax=Meripilus lineatus TaxID=2056292 RepID=A0AAD5UW02_9APHY|nr:hypothetical protein NLI96_g9287 [Physisporinus lineatus]
MSTNPSHILIARNSRGLNNPSATLSSPTETHAAAAGIFRSAGSPPWYLEECETDELVSDLSTDGDYEDPIDIDPTFTKASKLPGTVKIIVESTTFWAHKEVLFYASPFFEAALSGNWAETGRRQSISSVITISQPPSVPGEPAAGPTEMTFAPIDPDLDPEELDLDGDTKGDLSESDLSDCGVTTKEKARLQSLAKLQSTTSPPEPAVGRSSFDNGNLINKLGAPDGERPKAQAKIKRRQKANGPDAVIILKEEKASTFHDFLKFVYPHLLCTITWNNVEGLMNISHKLAVTGLQKECLTFLLTHAAGRPIKAMRIAELFNEEELYRESSRFVLDNPGGWAEQELSTLSPETLLKLEKRRTWFLERVLKLGLVQMAKEYQCCTTCPDPTVCARLLDEKWRQSYHAMFRFGPCQPSMVFRYLRMLEGVSPPLQLTHLSCQATAKAFAATLFDRMFSLGMRGNGPESQPLGARVAAVAGASSGPRRHFLYCALKNEPVTRAAKKSRDFNNA